MCCDSTHGASLSETVYGDKHYTNEEDRCKCMGFIDSALKDQAPCQCCLKMTGEDLRCNRCRQFCPMEAINSKVQFTVRR